MILKALLVVTSAAFVLGQRPFFAGSKPIGYPEIVTSTVAPGLDNKFGEDDSSTTTQKLPLEALGDKDLVDRLSKLPIDKQPFWFINWQALEAHRKNPQNYPQRPSTFIVGTQAASNFNSANGIVNPATSNGNSAGSNVNPASGTSSATANSNVGIGSLSNRNGDESDTAGLSSSGNISDSKKPNNSSASSSPPSDRNVVQTQLPGKIPASVKPTENSPTYQNQGNDKKANHQVNYYNGYGYY